MKWSPSLYSDDPAFIQQEEEKDLREAQTIILQRLALETVDHTGKRLNERKWKFVVGIVGAL